MIAFCTYFDSRYLPQGLALHRSLIRANPTAELWILCLDDDTHAILESLELERAQLVTPEELIEFEPRLGEARTDRDVLEFYYACTPQLIRFVESRAPGHGVSYVDADVFFFDDPASIYEDRDSTVFVVEHRSGDVRDEEERGRFNVCIVHFGRTDTASAALKWWGDQTLASTAMNEETWGDQKYLDQFPELFESIGILRSPAVTLAPWNVWQHRVTEASGDPIVDGQRLIAFHFARLLVLSPHVFSPARRYWLSRSVLSTIYRPYVRELRVSIGQVRSVRGDYKPSHMRKNRRGLLAGLVLGRLFYEGRFGIRRLGIYVPNTRKELRLQFSSARRRLAGQSELSHG